MNKELELWAYRYKEELLKSVTDYADDDVYELIVALKPEEVLLLIFENLDIAKDIDWYLIDRLVKQREDEQLPF